MPYPGPAPASNLDAGAGGQGGEGGSSGGICVRQMRLKVLYTFDDENKTNCLARWPHVLNVQTVTIEENTSIGVIELKTCIQAIVSASPELVAKLGQDYTVYAYDYSEYDTPLVGQGMLSWALASASPTPGAPAHQSRTMITGRVCKNILGIFSNGARETLEVKLRLVPVPTCLQSEYISSMDKYRELSKVMPTGFDASAWTSFVQSNPNLGQLVEQTELPTPAPYASSREGGDVPSTTPLIAPQPLRQSQQPPPSAGDYVSPYTRDSHTHTPEPRSEEPSHQATSNNPSYNTIDQPSRPSSRTSAAASTTNASRKRSGSQSKPSNGSVQQKVQDEGPARKRARVTKADWNGKPTLETSGESLRVAASTAAGMRMYRPIAMNPSQAAPNHLQEPPRAPTPRPRKGNQAELRGRPKSRSGLQRESSEQGGFQAHSMPQHRLDVQPSVESATTSPEYLQAGDPANSPVNIASSPPIPPCSSPALSSPTLPALPHQHDSGFMSTDLDDLFRDDDELRPLDAEDMELVNRHSKRPQGRAGCGDDFNDLGYRSHVAMAQPAPIGQAYPHTRPRSPAPSQAVESPEECPNSPSPTSRRHSTAEDAPVRTDGLAQDARGSRENSSRPNAPMVRALSFGKLTLPPTTASDPVLPPSNLHRSQTWAASTHPNSDVSGQPNVGAAGSRRQPKLERCGSGLKRKKAIQQRLQSAIESGELPPYCQNCGAIETPTWRKAWAKVFEGSPDNVKLSDSEGGVVAVVPQSKDEAGNVTSYSILKRSLLEGEEDFTEIQLCNPCGLWLQKFKCMRPEERWTKEPKDPNEKKKTVRKKKTGKPGSKTASGDDRGSEAEGSHQTTRSIKESSQETTAPTMQQEATSDREQRPAPAVRSRARASSMQPRKASGQVRGGLSSAEAAAALQRAIQSSPARLVGTAHSPIDVDDLGSTKRVLFPSPKKGLTTPAAVAIPTAADWAEAANGKGYTAALEDVDTNDKENQPPADDEMTRLFEEDGERPTTPSRLSTVDRLFKTPHRAHQQSSLTPSKSKVFACAGNDFLLPPRTPSARTGSDNPSPSVAEPSPFTAQLQAMFSEAPGPPLSNDFVLALPSLESAMSGTGTGTTPGRPPSFEFPGYGLDDVFSTDMAMPSSPPPAFFSLYEDPIDAADSGGLWSDYVGHDQGGFEGVLGEQKGQPMQDTGGEVGKSAIAVDDRGAASLTVDFSALIGEVTKAEKENVSSPAQVAADGEGVRGCA
ncbi:MAG: hypothetical protein M1817_005733 [Caeruleum heppii]|nr:MAG: hypothetical protein M1817_005733 [Caeruleum heppii]